MHEEREIKGIFIVIEGRGNLHNRNKSLITKTL